MTTNSFELQSIPLSSLDSSQNINDIPIHEALLRMRTVVSNGIPSEYFNGPLRLSKNMMSLNYEPTLEIDSPKASVIGKEFPNFPGSGNRSSLSTLFPNLKSIRFDFGNFQHIKMLIFVLKKKPLARTEEELGFLQEVFSYIPFFQSFQKEFDQDTLETLLRKLRYEYGKKDRKIFNFGDMGRKFYIILSGAVSVLVPKIVIHKNAPEKEDDEEDEIQDKKIMFTLVNELKSGECFGEIALLNSVPRTATCICKEDTHFVVLTAETYMKIVAQYHKIQFWELLDILDNSQYFKGWPTELKNVMALHLKLKQRERNTVLYKENDPVEFIYLIKSGEVEISKEVISQQSKKSPATIEIHDNIELLKHEQRNSKAKVPMENESKNRKKHVIQERQTLCLLGSLELFGEDELYSLDKRSTKAEVKSTNALIYEISVKKVIENIPRELILGMKALNKNRWKWRHSILRTSKKVTSLFENSTKQPLYKTKSKFKRNEDLLDHINEKNSEVLKKLPLTFSFNHKNNQFFRGIQKYYPPNEQEEEKSDLEKAIFPNTTLIPFKKKLHALALGLRHFRISTELKNKLEGFVRENSLRNQVEQRPQEDYHIEDIFYDDGEDDGKEEPKDLLAGFIVQKDKINQAEHTKKKKKVLKKENPLIAISQNLNLKFNENSSKKQLDKDLFISTYDGGSQMTKKPDTRIFLPNQSLVKTLMKESGNKYFGVTEKSFKARDKKMVSLINISKVLELENENRVKKKDETCRAGIRRNRNNIKDLRASDCNFLKNERRKLIFVTESQD